MVVRQGLYTHRPPLIAIVEFSDRQERYTTISYLVGSVYSMSCDHIKHSCMSRLSKIRVVRVNQHLVQYNTIQMTLQDSEKDESSRGIGKRSH